MGRVCAEAESIHRHERKLAAMLKNRVISGLCAAFILIASGLLSAGDGLKSGLQPGEMIPSAFHPLNVTGPHAGKMHCLVCENGLNPVAMIFAREVDEPLVRLLVKIDVATAKHRARDMGSFVVFLSNDEKLDQHLQGIAKKNAFKNIVLSIDDPAGLEDYKVVKGADVTVVLYNKHVVRANHAFKKGELTDKAIERIIADLPKILGDK